MRVLAIDQGTTSTRGLLFEDDVPPQVVASFRHGQHYPQPGWVEHDPEELLRHLRACIAAAGRIDAIGLANQGESCLAWDARTGRPLSPVIVWQDRRTEAAVAALVARGLGGHVTARTGLPLDCYFSASKLAWLMTENEAVRAAARAGRLRLGATDAFFLDRLGGVYATDPSTAARTSLMDLATRAWCAEMCALFGVPLDALPPIRPTTERFGAHDGVPITASLVDQPAALFGHGARRPGDAKITFGTGAFALVHAGGTPPDPGGSGLIATVAWTLGDATDYALEGGVYDAGAVIEWARRIGIVGGLDELDRLPAAPAIGRGLCFVPALSGLACPQWQGTARGQWSGIAHATSRADLQCSLLEGIALQTCEVLRALDARVPLGPAIGVDGGLSASDVFLQFLADASGRTILRAGEAELTARGVAWLAGLPEGEPIAPAATFAPNIGEDERHAWRVTYADAVARTTLRSRHGLDDRPGTLNQT